MILNSISAPKLIRLLPRQIRPLQAAPDNRQFYIASGKIWLNGVMVSSLALVDAAHAADPAARSSGGLLAPIANTLEVVLNTLQSGLQYLHVPYSYGFSIILLTVIVKTLTFPFTKKQVESTMAMQSLKPRIDNIKLRYGDDKQKVQRETSILYEEAGVDPTAGCFPTLATIPILWGLFRTLSNVANEGLLDTEGFLWIPSLAGPTSMAARRAGTGTAWLLPFVDGAPPIGWDDASRYLALPVLLVGLQYLSSKVISPVDPNDDNSGNFTKYLIAVLPLVVGWFALNVPSGLTLYYFSNTVITTGQQFWLRRLGGAQIEMNDLGPVTKLGMGRRTGTPLEEPKQPEPEAKGESEVLQANGVPVGDGAVPRKDYDTPEILIRTRSKRKRRDWIPKETERTEVA